MLDSSPCLQSQISWHFRLESSSDDSCDGEVVFADATRIEVRYERSEDQEIALFTPEVTVYELPRYRRTNQNTTVTLKPTVLTGDKVVKGQILTEGYSTEKGELALGRNLKVAFMPWKGSKISRIRR